jgi:hypothetical protein
MSTLDADALRAEVAARRRLDARAAGFLVGTTLSELEASADKLRELLTSACEQELMGLFDASARGARKRELTALFVGAPAQPRDEQGRYLRRSFDGGARPMELRRAETHDELIARLVVESRLHWG